jgi:4-amino-4-deoxy-L-arabinose transferase-like glycosyltransferase
MIALKPITFKPFDALNIESTLVLGLIGAFWLLAFSGIRLLTLPDEGRYVGVAWEMVASGNWLVPTLDGMPYFHKPPLFYWLSAAAISVFGVSEWGVRLVPAFSAWLAVMGLYVFIKQYKNSQTATIAAYILLTQPFFFLGAQFANLDMLVAGMISAAVMSGAHAVLQKEQQRAHIKFIVLMYFFVALAVLSKGLIGVVIPGGILFCWLMFGKRFVHVITLLWLPGMLFFLAITAPWFVMMQYQFPDFYNYFFIYHHFQRFANKGFNNVQPLYFYPVVIVLLTLPWSLILLRLFKRGVLAQTLPTKDLGSLLWIWFIVVVVFFSIPGSKLIGYVLPALPALAGLVSLVLMQWTNLSSGTVARKWFAIVLAAVMVASALGTVAIYYATDNSQKPQAQQFGSLIQQSDEVFVLGKYPFDLPFYLHLKKPLWIVHDWANPDIINHDNWIKELYDAHLFKQKNHNEIVNHLIQTQNFESALCEALKKADVWVWAKLTDVPKNSILLQIQTISQGAHSDASHHVWQLKSSNPVLSQRCSGQ